MISLAPAVGFSPCGGSRDTDVPTANPPGFTGTDDGVVSVAADIDENQRAGNEAQTEEDFITMFATEYGAWPHQIEALQNAFGRNVIVNMPTGTGKTLVACMLLDILLKPGSGMQSLFLVNSTALIPQQAGYLLRHTKCGITVATLSGEGLSGSPTADVIVGTAEVFRRRLEGGQLLVSSINAIVLDEAHYAVGRHPYAETMSLIWNGGGNPRVLGLTASFLHGSTEDPEKSKHVLEGNLHAEVIWPSTVKAKGDHHFIRVPWESGASVSPTEIQFYEETLACFVETMNQRFNNWELHTALEKETSKVRGVIEGLGHLGWYYFLHDGLVQVILTRLKTKASYCESDVFVRSNLEDAIALIPSLSKELADFACSSFASRCADGNKATQRQTTGKCEALIALLGNLLHGTADQAIVFVERVLSTAPMAKIVEDSLAIQTVFVCGVQAMEEPTRTQSLDSFRCARARILVATASLEEGLDVPACRYVVRYDWFASAKSHVQGAGRARHPEAKVYYFENCPVAEEGRRDIIESVARGEPIDTPMPPTTPNPSPPPGLVEDGLQSGVGVGHAWGPEETMWNYAANISFRGTRCQCGASLHITSRAFGRGRKKKERIFCVQGPFECPRFQMPPDSRFLQTISSASDAHIS
eukprot:TRINITY_DN24852_c0_g1_i1.p1 TRINITY_DN24852_c0_g1~~TRINITY_DN24852_c0_g1_i1.p1  ORF type:complete len:644 (-),score=95.09 TRINITY_DN24852_c0_g1_i1:132-2063(-)